MKKQLVLLFALAYANLLLAQDSLYILDADNRQAVANAQLQILDEAGRGLLSAPLFSSEKGLFVLDSFVEGQFVLITHLNYHRYYGDYFELKAKKGRLLLQRRPIDLIEVLVQGSSKREEPLREVPSQLTLIDKKEIEILQPQTTAAVMENSGEVFVQRSQMGGGSPIIRGFEANKVLIVLDGIRMNNAIYRAGHLQNIITIDPAIIEGVELHHGPASTIYGSDALGGVMYIKTKSPRFLEEQGKEWHIHAYSRFSTANLERRLHSDIHWSGERWASLSSLSFSKYGDLRAGRYKADSSMARYWNRYFYVERDEELGQDLIRINENPNVQLGSAYGQMDLMQKLRYRYNERLDFEYNFQYSTSTEVPRYDQLTEGDVSFSNGQIISQNLEYAEWSYGPQKRLLSALRANIKGDSSRWLGQGQLVAAFQKIDEERISRKFNDPLRRTQAEQVYVLTLNADFLRKICNKQELLYGAEWTHNWVSSTAFTENIETGEQSNRGLGTRYPDGGSQMGNFGLYSSYRLKFAQEKAKLILGSRYTYTSLSASYLDTLLYSLPYQDLSLQTHALTASAGLSWDLGRQFQLRAVASTAFRTPNIDDMAKLRAKGNNVTVPNAEIGPEKSLNMELGLSKQFAKKLKISSTVYYNYLFDAIVQQEYSINGQDSMYYDGRFRNIQALVNIGRGAVWGLHASLAYELNDFAFFKWSLVYTEGIDYSEAEPQPLPHIPPLYGQWSFHYQKKAFSLQSNIRFNGPKRLEDYADESSENLDQALPSGTPAWFVINCYTAYELSSKWKLQLGIENLLDWHYRPYASGISAPGQNIILTLRANL